MSIKAIIFDLDGVLVDSKKIHFEALNSAIEHYDKQYLITMDEHLTTFDGLPTINKLEILKKRGLNKNLADKIVIKKNEITKELLNTKIKRNSDIYNLFLNLKKSKYKLAIATNAVRSTLDSICDKLEISKFLDFTISNQDINNSKPHSEIYLKCFIALQINPKEALILEDSHIGRKSAYESGANVMEIENINEVKNLESIFKTINQYDENINNSKWKAKMNIIVPMAGRGKRFLDKGYAFPKPLISVKNKPLIQLVVENLNIEAKYIFLVLKDHYEKYSLDFLLPLISNNNCEIVIVDKITEGAACTVLLAEKFIDNETPLLIANSDQYIEWDSAKTMYSLMNSNVDGGILTFNSTHPKWSFAKVNQANLVTEVAEKKPISNFATVGIYYWKKGCDFVRYSKKMISEKDKVNNEYYVCPVYNYAIKDGKKITIKMVDEMWGLGTPEDLESFLIKKT